MTYSISQRAGVAMTQALVVEADVELAGVLKGQAERIGYRVCGVVDNLFKAVSLAKRLHPDVVLMDSRLAGDGDSIENSELIMPRFSMPVILLIAAGDQVNLQRVAKSARHGYLVVPFAPREL